MDDAKHEAEAWIQRALQQLGREDHRAAIRYLEEAIEWLRRLEKPE